MDFQQANQNQQKPKLTYNVYQKGKPFVKKGRNLIECSAKFQFIIKGVPLVLYDHYQVVKRVGDGAYGVVFKAIDRSKSNELVAIKKMSDAFRDPRDAKRILREIKLLKFCDHPNIIKLKDIIKPELPAGYHDIYLVLEYMEIDLDKTINSDQPLAPRLIQSLMWQLLNGIYYMHSAEIIHRDIKPSNILLLKNCTLKLADMNLARKFDLDERITEYVVTRPYRAPEILLSTQNYSKPIDIWSAGCIFAEMMGRKTIFKGTSYLNQLDRIVAIIGKPDFDKLSYKVDESLRDYLKKFSDKQPENFYEIYKSHDKLAIDLLYKMLAFDPKERWTAEQCLYHPYFINFNKSDIKACQVKFDWSFDEIQERNDVIQRAIYNESCEYHPDEPDSTEEEVDNYYKQQKQMQQQMQGNKIGAKLPTQQQLSQAYFNTNNHFQMSIEKIAKNSQAFHAGPNFQGSLSNPFVNFPTGFPGGFAMYPPNAPMMKENFKQQLLNQTPPLMMGKLQAPLAHGTLPMKPLQKNFGNPFSNQMVQNFQSLDKIKSSIIQPEYGKEQQQLSTNDNQIIHSSPSLDIIDQSQSSNLELFKHSLNSVPQFLQQKTVENNSNTVQEKSTNSHSDQTKQIESNQNEGNFNQNQILQTQDSQNNYHPKFMDKENTLSEEKGKVQSNIKNEDCNINQDKTLIDTDAINFLKNDLGKQIEDQSEYFQNLPQIPPIRFKTHTFGTDE